MAQEVTKTQLTELISDQVKSILKGEGLAGILDVINERVAKAIEPLSQAQSDFTTKLFDRLGPARADVPQREKGLAFGRIVRAVGMAKRQGGGMAQVAEVLKGWGDTDLAEAQTKALSASVAADGGYLIAEQYSTDILANRKAATVVRRAGPREIPMPTGNMHLPKVATGVSGGYIGENANLTASQPVFGENILNWKKLAVLTPLSNDLMRYNSPSSEDAAFIRGDGTNGSPKGMRFWAAAGNLIAAQAASLANVTVDLGKAIYFPLNANVPITKGAWFFGPRVWFYLYTLRDANGNYAFKPELDKGTLFSYPFYLTTSIPINLTVGANSDCSEVYFANMDDCAIGDSQRLLVDVSSEAAYHNGSSVVAAFSLDQTVIRAIAEHDFVVRDPNAVAVITGVRWGA